jgi:hypothetical protein
LRLLEEAGGSVRSMLDFSPREQAAMYVDLFERRWGFAARGAAPERSIRAAARIHDRCSCCLRNDQPIAIQILYRVEAPQWISLEYINGGVDPQAQRVQPRQRPEFTSTRATPGRMRARSANPCAIPSGAPIANTRIAGAIACRSIKSRTAGLAVTRSPA